MSERAPVAMMSVLALSVGSGRSRSPIQMPIGVEARSTLDALSVRISAPKRSAWARIDTMSSGPSTPWAKPGKFSTSVVSMSWPPG